MLQQIKGSLKANDDVMADPHEILLLKDAASLEISRIIQNFCFRDRMKKLREMRKTIQQTFP